MSAARRSLTASAVSTALHTSRPTSSPYRPARCSQSSVRSSSSSPVWAPRTRGRRQSTGWTVEPKCEPCEALRLLFRSLLEDLGELGRAADRLVAEPFGAFGRVLAQSVEPVVVRHLLRRLVGDGRPDERRHHCPRCRRRRVEASFQLCQAARAGSDSRLRSSRQGARAVRGRPAGARAGSGSEYRSFEPAEQLLGAIRGVGSDELPRRPVRAVRPAEHQVAWIVDQPADGAVVIVQGGQRTARQEAKLLALDHPSAEMASGRRRSRPWRRGRAHPRSRRTRCRRRSGRRLAIR